MTLDFPDTDVAAVTRVMAEILGRPIVLDPRTKGKVTLYTEQPVTKAQAYEIYVAALRGLGYATIESNGLLKVLPEADAKLQSGTVATSLHERSGDAIATQVFRLVHENASNLLPVLRPLITPNNTINVNAGNNSLVITDYASNLARLAQIVDALDTPSATDVEVIPLEHALASELAATVQRMTDTSPIAAAGSGSGAPAAGAAVAAGGSSSASGGSASIVADVHANALLVRAPNPTRLASIRALVARLDRPGGSGAAGSNVHVVYLKYAEATRLATVLRAAFSGDAMRVASAGSANIAGSYGAGSSGGAASGSAVSTSSRATSAGSSGSSNGSSGSSSEVATPVASTAQPATGGYIQADPATNSLIITAPGPLFRELRAAIDLLDSRRAQLYVESLVVEVDASKALDVGVQWKQIFNISATIELTLGTVAQAIESTSGTNILSTANLITLDNEEAKIVVGQNVPFVTGSYTSTSSSTTSPFQTIERKDVGLTLRIRPQIGPDGTIRMSIFQESSTVSSGTSPGTTNAGPTTNKRAIESTVVVNDGKIIVLGGLIEDSYSSDANQIPLLGELPVVGGLFRSLGRSRKKTNLMVFLRPIVLRDEAATDDITLDRYDHIRARQRQLPEDVRKVLRDEGMPLAIAAPQRPPSPSSPSPSTPSPPAPSPTDGAALPVPAPALAPALTPSGLP